MLNIEKNVECQNITGYKTLEIIPIAEIESVIAVNATTKAVKLAKGGSWADVEAYNIKVGMNYKNDYFQTEISCDFRTNENQDALFNAMTKNRFVCKLTDNNGKTHLYGTKTEPLRFEFDFVGNPDPSQAKEYKLSFFGNTTAPSCLVQ